MSSYKRRTFIHGFAKIREVSRDVNLFLEKRLFKLAAIKQKELIQGLKMNDREYKAELLDLIDILILGSRPDEALDVIDDVLKLDHEQKQLVPLRGILLHAMKHSSEARQILDSFQNPPKKGCTQEEIPTEEVDLLKRALEEVPQGGIEVVQQILLDDKRKSMNASETKDNSTTKEPNLPDSTRPAKPLKGSVPNSPAKGNSEASKASSVSKKSVNKPLPPPADLPANVLGAATLRQKLEARKKNAKSTFQILAELEAQKLADEMNAQKAIQLAAAAAAQKSSPPKKESRPPVGGTMVKAWADTARLPKTESPSLEAEYPALGGAKVAKPVPAPVEIPIQSTSSNNLDLSPSLSRSSSSSSIPSPQPATHQESPMSPTPSSLYGSPMPLGSTNHWQQVAVDAQQRLCMIESEMAKVIGLFDGIRAEYENRAMVDHARSEKALQEQRLKNNRLQMAHNVLVTLVKNQVESLIPEEFFCPISLEMMHEPVMTTSGHSYERSAIERVLKTREEDPLTRTPCKICDLRPNYSLKTAIDSWKRTRDSMRVALSAAQMYSIFLSPEQPAATSERALEAHMLNTSMAQPATVATNPVPTESVVAQQPSAVAPLEQEPKVESASSQQTRRKKKNNSKKSVPRPHRV